MQLNSEDNLTLVRSWNQLAPAHMAHIMLSGKSTFLQYLLMKEAYDSRPVVVFAFNQWFLLTPRLGAFHFSRIEEIPRFDLSFYNDILCLVDATGSDPRHPSEIGLHLALSQSEMRIVQVCSGLDDHVVDWFSYMTHHFVMNPPSMTDIQQMYVANLRPVYSL